MGKQASPVAVAVSGVLGVLLGSGIGLLVGWAVWADWSDEPVGGSGVVTVQSATSTEGCTKALNDFSYDPKTSSHERKTNSFMPFMPVRDGYFQTHATYRFLSVREQVLTVIGEAKHGLWRIHDNGMVRLYRVHGAEGVPVGAEVSDARHEATIARDYRAVLKPGVETGDDAGWGGYRYSQDADGDGQAAFVDLPIYHQFFQGKYEDHVPIDLPHFFCTMSGPNFTNARDAWDFAVSQPNANQVGPLGRRAGLDIREHYTNVIRMELLPDAKVWIGVGLGNESRDTFDQTDVDDGSMSLDVGFLALDRDSADCEVYLIERPFFNVPYIFVTVVWDNHDNTDMQYIRPDGPYWEKLVEKGLVAGLKTTMTFNPVVPVIQANGSKVDRTLRGTPLYGLNHLDRPQDDGSGGWCPQKGGDWGSYPSNPGGAGFPNEYEEATPVCDGVVLDIKMYSNLDVPTWNSPMFQLSNAGTGENPQVYLGDGNQYGDFTDPYLVAQNMTNPHKLHFTATNNPDPLPVQKIWVNFGDIGFHSKYVDMQTKKVMPPTAQSTLTGPETLERARRQEGL